MWRSNILLVATRVDPTRVGGFQLFLTGVSWYKPTYDIMGPVEGRNRAFLTLVKIVHCDVVYRRVDFGVPIFFLS